MQPDPMRCTECGGEMEIGFILDRTQNYFFPQSWTKDPPKKRWWGTVKVNRDECRTVETNRCKACGFLKSYAKPPVAALSE
jgi:hypothetical protein